MTDTVVELYYFVVFICEKQKTKINHDEWIQFAFFLWENKLGLDSSCLIKLKSGL